MVSIMDEALDLEIGQKILEIGSGSGWHAATIAEIIAPSDIPREKQGHIFSVERIPELATSARKNIKKTGYANRVSIIHSDGTLGYPKEAPYDRILVAAAGPEIPKPLVDQLKNDGILLVPVGKSRSFQTLIRVRKKNKKIFEENLGTVVFVPLIGKYGFKSY